MKNLEAARGGRGSQLRLERGRGYKSVKEQVRWRSKDGGTREVFESAKRHGLRRSLRGVSLTVADEVGERFVSPWRQDELRSGRESSKKEERIPNRGNQRSPLN